MTGKSSTTPKHEIFDRIGEVAKGLAHGRRLELLELLAQREWSVDALAQAAGLPIANTSQHLRLMRQSGLLVSRRVGKQILYRLSDRSVLDAVFALRHVAEDNLAEVRDLIGNYFGKRDNLEPVSRKELARRIRDDLVTVLDVRSEEEFAAGHITKAINIPVGDLGRRLKELPIDREIVAYCRGPYCVFAVEAANLLRKRGFKIRRLEDGYPEWKAAGLPVA